MKQLYGFDGLALTVGDRVQFHPATSMWLSGARYGQIVEQKGDRFYVVPDHVGGRVRFHPDNLRAVS